LDVVLDPALHAEILALAFLARRERREAAPEARSAGPGGAAGQGR
jgi:hypothetical protein